MLKDEVKEYHIQLDKSQGARYAICPGDPGRVEKIAQLLDEPEFVGCNREYNTWAGKLCGERVLVISTGIGAPSSAICFEELAHIGVDTIIRTGTCGGMDLSVMANDVIIANAAIRQDGTTLEYMPIEFPAVADFNVTAALAQAAKDLEYPSHVGVVQAKDSFYGQHSPDSMPTAGDLNYKWNAWLKGGCLASEMESGCLFIVGAIRRLRTGAVFSCVWNQEREKAGLHQDNNHDTSRAVKCAVEGLKLLIMQDQNNK